MQLNIFYNVIDFNNISNFSESTVKESIFIPFTTWIFYNRNNFYLYNQPLPYLFVLLNFQEKKTWKVYTKSNGLHNTLVSYSIEPNSIMAFLMFSFINRLDGLYYDCTQWKFFRNSYCVHGYCTNIYKRNPDNHEFDRKNGRPPPPPFLLTLHPFSPELFSHMTAATFLITHSHSSSYYFVVRVQ